jgi:hypothetical protein
VRYSTALKKETNPSHVEGRKITFELERAHQARSHDKIVVANTNKDHEL